MIKCYVEMISKLRSVERGAVAGEYAVLLAVIAVGIAVSLGLFGDAIIGALDNATGIINP